MNIQTNWLKIFLAVAIARSCTAKKYAKTAPKQAAKGRQKQYVTSSETVVKQATKNYTKSIRRNI
jgi:hypothetical protein